jgi:hypothetical protein
MKTKLIYAAAVLLLVFASAGAVTRKSKIEIVYQPQANGDYRLFLFGQDRTLVCEEEPIRVVEQGDAVNPIVIECKH